MRNRAVQGRGWNPHRPVNKVPFLTWIIVCERNNNGRVIIGSLELGKVFRVTISTLEVFVIWSDQYLHVASPRRKVGTHRLELLYR